MSVSPQAALVDQPVAVTVTGLPAGARATLTAYYGGLTDDALTSFGGTVAGTQATQADAHTKLLALLASQ